MFKRLKDIGLSRMVLGGLATFLVGVYDGLYGHLPLKAKPRQKEFELLSPLPLKKVTVGSLSPGMLRTSTQVMCRPVEIVLWGSEKLIVTDIKIGNKSQLLNRGEIPLSAFGLSHHYKIHCDVLHCSQEITLEFRNDTQEKLEVSGIVLAKIVENEWLDT